MANTDIQRRQGLITFYVLAAVVAVCIICLAIIARNWSCRESRHDRREDRKNQIITYGPYSVVRAASGNCLECYSGRRPPKVAGEPTELPRKVTTYLALIGVPADGEAGEESRKSLEKFAGKEITVRCKRESRRPEVLTGEVYGTSAEPLQVQQLREGWAMCSKDAPDTYNAAQAEAQAAHRGVWGKRGNDVTKLLLELEPEEE